MTSEAAKALKAEAEKPEFIEIEFRGDTYKIPGDPEDWDIEVVEAYEDEKITHALRALLGPEQWAFLKTKNKLKSKDLLEVSNVFFAAMDADLGK